MTEISDNSKKLPASIERFVLQWGDLGSQWGVNRSISQIHALLYVSESPMTADEIAEILEIARSNVSTSLKELLSSNLVHRVPLKGDRRDYFAAEADIWEVAIRIAAMRKAREIDPALVTLRSCIAEADSDPSVSVVSQKRLREMLEFTATADRWYIQMLGLPRSKLKLLMKLGAKVASFLPAGKS